MVNIPPPLHDLPSDPSARFDAWATGIRRELSFWMEWARTRGSQWPAEFAQRMDPATRLARGISDHATKAGLTHLRLLDVGAGPMTWLGHVPPKGMSVDLVACDPLADAYAQCLDSLGLVPPVPVQFALAEELSAVFAPESFDIVHCRQALDCCYDPARALVEMLRLVKVGGAMMIFNMPNQAAAEGYLGFRQYNLEVVEERLFLWRGAARWSLEELLPAGTEISVHDRGQISAVVTKREPFPPQAAGWLGTQAGEAWRARVNRAIRAAMGWQRGVSPQGAPRALIAGGELAHGG